MLRVPNKAVRLAIIATHTAAEAMASLTQRLEEYDESMDEAAPKAKRKQRSRASSGSYAAPRAKNSG